MRRKVKVVAMAASRVAAAAVWIIMEFYFLVNG